MPINKQIGTKITNNIQDIDTAFLITVKFDYEQFKIPVKQEKLGF